MRIGFKAFGIIHKAVDIIEIFFFKVFKDAVAQDRGGKVEMEVFDFCFDDPVIFDFKVLCQFIFT